MLFSMFFLDDVSQRAACDLLKLKSERGSLAFRLDTTVESTEEFWDKTHKQIAVVMRR